MALLLGDSDFGKHIENGLTFDFQLSCQIVDSNLAHPPFRPPDCSAKSSYQPHGVSFQVRAAACVSARESHLLLLLGRSRLLRGFSCFFSLSSFADSSFRRGFYLSSDVIRGSSCLFRDGLFLRRLRDCFTFDCRFTDKPITTIINTHTHGDHNGSNAEFAGTIEFVAQENTKTNMQKMDAFQGEAAKYLPARTFKDKMSLLGGTDQIDLYYFGPGHTNGDAIVVFKGLRVAHTGDLFAGPNAPYIDASNGGTGVEYPKTLAKAAAGISGVDTIIPGHSAVTTWTAFQDYGDFNRDFVAAVQAAMTAGKSPEEAAASLKLAERWTSYGMDRAADDVKQIYMELKK
jgi:glyoxylase-like metal-dependent hydrolase (beta-lactamase superfamily II)